MRTRKINWLSMCGLILAGLLIMMFVLSKNKQLTTEATEVYESEKKQVASVEKAVVLYNAGKRGSYSSYDATDSLVFFAYTEQAACVDAYNHSGEYQFTISFAHRDRGSIDIRCYDNLLFIDSKYSNVFVFDADQCIEKLSPDIADSKGYTSVWFQKRTMPIKMGLSAIYRYNEVGNITSEIVIPSAVFWNNCQQYVLFCGVVTCFAVKYARYKKRNL